MSHVTPGENGKPPSRGDLLTALLLKRRISKIALARMLAGEGADHQAIENKRSQVRDWTKPRAGFANETAELLEQLLELPPGYFTNVPDGRSQSHARRLKREEEADLVKVVIQKALRVVAELAEQVEELGGSVSADALEELAQAGRRLQP